MPTSLLLLVNHRTGALTPAQVLPVHWGSSLAQSLPVAVPCSVRANRLGPTASSRGPSRLHSPCCDERTRRVATRTTATRITTTTTKRAPTTGRAPRVSHPARPLQLPPPITRQTLPGPVPPRCRSTECPHASPATPARATRPAPTPSAETKAHPSSHRFASFALSRRYGVATRPLYPRLSARPQTPGPVRALLL
jgi:hypothetical protein